MNKERQRKMIYEAVRLSEIFPDLSPLDVIEHIEYVFDIILIPESNLERGILTAYKSQNEHRGLSWIY